MKAAVIGSPVSHSLSPAIFEFISVDQGRVIDYQATEVKSEACAEFLKNLKDSTENVGLNVTIPLKEIVKDIVDEVSDAARVIGAVNVIHHKQQKLCGHNTDVVGISKTFSRLNFQIKDTVCLLWGAGGSAKAVAYALGTQGARKVYIYNRGSRGADLARQFSAEFKNTVFEVVSELSEVHSVLDLTVNTTPLGMQGQESGADYFSGMKTLKFSAKALAFDLIYIPAVTDFIRVAQSLKLKTVGGLGMLIDQALATWEIWIGPLKNADSLYQRLSVFLRGILNLRLDSTPVYLSGFMGVGKTTVGQKLSLMVKKEFLDTDKVIEGAAKKTIPEIFSSLGEEEFRRLEKEAVKEVSLRKQVVVSLGGGALTKAENLEVLKQSGTLIYLAADPAVLEKRITEQKLNRPLLQGLNQDEKLLKIKELLSLRTEAYKKSQYTIHTDSLNTSQVCFEIISKWGELS